MTRFRLSVLMGIFVLFLSVGALASEHYFVAPTTTIYVYQERDVYGLVLDRTRAAEDLVLSAWTEDEPIDYRVFLNARLLGEFGADETQIQALAQQGRLSVQLLSANIRLKRIFDAIDLRFGRSLLSDSYGMLLMDGVDVTIRRNWFWGAQFFVGSPVRSIERSYVRPGKYPPPDYNPFSEVYIDEGFNRDRALALGMSLFLDNVPNTMVKLSWRRSFASWPAKYIESDILSGAASELLFDGLLELNLRGTYNLFAEELQEAYADVTVRFFGVTVTTSYSYSLPLFPSWSIFALFPYLPNRLLGLYVFGRIDDEWSVSARIDHRLYNDGGIFPSNIAPEGRFSDELGISVAYNPKSLPLEVSLYGTGAYGYGGDYGFVTLRGKYEPSKRASFELAGTVQFYGQLTWLDELYSARVFGVGGSVFGAVSYYIVPEFKLSAASEYISTPILARDFRMLLRLEVMGIP